MFAYPFRTAALAAVAVIGLSACASPYGYSGVSVGIGSGGYYDPYYGYGYRSGYPRYGYGYGYAPYWGWYDDFYYPGTGYYVYDSYRRPHRWSDAQRRYWTIRRQRALSSGGDRIVVRDNWDDFRRRVVRSSRSDRIRADRLERARPIRVERIRSASVKSEARSAAREERRARVSADREDRSSRSRGRQRGNNQEQ